MTSSGVKPVAEEKRLGNTAETFQCGKNLAGWRSTIYG
jgi:hypothetical protein